MSRFGGRGAEALLLSLPKVLEANLPELGSHSQKQASLQPKLVGQVAELPLVTRDGATSGAVGSRADLACRGGCCLWVVELFRQLDLGYRLGVGGRNQ